MARRCASSGSSPHTRGTRVWRIANILKLRFIPAYAGNALTPPTDCTRPGVHPRIRGERASRNPPLPCPLGSSPHTRGTPPPLHAGPACSAVHPRIRGERVLRLAEIDRQAGSSPHTRGTPVSRCADDHQCRFIPAYAGNAAWGATLRAAASVHPRIRGERKYLSKLDAIDHGSSPHTRGTLDDKTLMVPRDRFIPAYAGNACRCRPWRAICTVHPRIRGERPLKLAARLHAHGSSPHTRGTRLPALSCPRDRRFIPAYAGNAARGNG